jgi:uncharacterized lipoprotein YmbA
MRRLSACFNINLSLIVLFVFSLTGCSSAPVSLHYYSLTNTANSASEQNSPLTFNHDENKKLLLIAPIKLADFLSMGGIAMQLSEHQMQISEQYRWANNLNTAISQVLEENLTTELPQYHIESSTNQWQEQKHHQLVISFSHFNVGLNHKVIAAGNYWLFNDNDNLIVKRHFNIAKNIDNDGYESAVTSLNQTLVTLAQQIANDLH